MPVSLRVTHLLKRPNASMIRLLAGRRFSPIVLLNHTGRRSGKRYQVPLVAFSTPEELIVVLTYGPEVDWRRNLSAAGSGTLVSHGQTIRVGAPIVTDDLARTRAVFWPVRRFMAMLSVTEVARLPRLSTDAVARPISTEPAGGRAS